jgi:hypothetical protein
VTKDAIECIVHVHAMEVEEELSRWPEKSAAHTANGSCALKPPILSTSPNCAKSSSGLHALAGSRFRPAGANRIFTNRTISIHAGQQEDTSLLKRAGKFSTFRRSWRCRRASNTALPWRMTDGTLEVLLLTSRGTGRWVIPEGLAARCAFFRPIGCTGSLGRSRHPRIPITEEPIGSYRYDKVRDEGGSVECVVYVHALAVEEQLDDWPEKGQRELQWFPRADGGRVGRRAGTARSDPLFAAHLPYA